MSDKLSKCPCGATPKGLFIADGFLRMENDTSSFEEVHEAMYYHPSREGTHESVGELREKLGRFEQWILTHLTEDEDEVDDSGGTVDYTLCTPLGTFVMKNEDMFWSNEIRDQIPKEIVEQLYSMYLIEAGEQDE